MDSMNSYSVHVNRSVHLFHVSVQSPLFQISWLISSKRIRKFNLKCLVDVSKESHGKLIKAPRSKCLVNDEQYSASKAAFEAAGVNVTDMDYSEGEKEEIFVPRKSKTRAKTQRRAASEILRMEAAFAGIERKAQAAILGEVGNKFQRNLYPKTVLEALSDRIRKNQWESALLIFELMRKQQWYQPKPEIYLKLLVMLGKCKQPTEAYRLFEKMLEERCKKTVEIYTALIGAYGRNGLLDEAFAVLDQMKLYPHCQPNIFTYNTCISSCVRFGDFDRADRLVTEMASRGIKANIVTLNAILDGYGKAGKLKEMENILPRMMQHSEWMPDVCTMNAVLKAFGDKGEINSMEHWYQKFYDIGILPSDHTFNIMVSIYGKNRLYKRMSTLLDNMRKNFCSWTIVTYNTVIDAYGKGGELDRMEYYYKLMIAEGIKPNAVTLCCLVSAFGRAHNTYKISKILNQLENSDIVPDTAFFNAIIDTYGNIGDLAGMEKIIELMKKWQRKPNDRTLKIMIKAYAKGGMFEKVNNLKKVLSQR